MSDKGQSRGRVSIRGMLQTLAAFMIFMLLFHYVAQLCRDKSGDSAILNPSQVSQQQIDVIFAGSSHMDNAVHPMTLWQEYGFTSFNNGQSGQIIPVSYYACKEAIELYHPSVLVLDVYMLYYGRTYGNLTWMHQSLDLLTPINRTQAVLDLLPEENRKEYLAPFTLYHARWDKLISRDFTSDLSALPVRRGCKMDSNNFTVAEDIMGMTFEYVGPEIKTEPPKTAVEYLERIVALCRETDTKLVLVALPYFISSEYEGATHNMSSDQAYFNWTADFAAERGVDCINYFHLTEEIGFDHFSHLYNYSHMNYWGGEIITEHIGRYLSERYDLPDRRNDPVYEDWNTDCELYLAEVEKQLANASR